MAFYLLSINDSNGFCIKAVAACDATTGEVAHISDVKETDRPPPHIRGVACDGPYAKIIILHRPTNKTPAERLEYIYLQMDDLRLTTGERENVAHGYKKWHKTEMPPRGAEPGKAIPKPIVEAAAPPKQAPASSYTPATIDGTPLTYWMTHEQKHKLIQHFKAKSGQNDNAAKPMLSQTAQIEKAIGRKIGYHEES